MEVDHIGELPPEITEQQVTELLAEVRHQTILHWNYRRLRILPEQVLRESSHIHQIYLKRNLLTHLPDSIRCLSQLTYCYLHGNRLEALPDAIGELTSLQVLDIGNNKIRHLPTTLGKLPSLRSLVAVYNQISHFPKELCNLKTLSVLMLSGNNLSYLPEAIGGLTGLQGLYVDHNHLRELPRSIASLPLLTRISCCCNNLTHLPALHFSSKPTLFFDDNPQINYLPYSLLQQLRTGESWDPIILQTCGCFEEKMMMDNIVSINITGPFRNYDPLCLILPPQINRISTSSKQLSVPPLTELCLRYVWKEKRRSSSPIPSQKLHVNLKLSNLSPSLLPPNIHSLLQIGPVAHCCYGKCSSPIFTYSHLTIIKVTFTIRTGGRGNIIPSLLYFCSGSCNQKYFQNVKSMKDPFSLWLLRKLEDACTIHLL